jgi:hypothetical protein
VAFVFDQYGLTIEVDDLVLTVVCRDCQRTCAEPDWAARWLASTNPQ